MYAALVVPDMWAGLKRVCADEHPTCTWTTSLVCSFSPPKLADIFMRRLIASCKWPLGVELSSHSSFPGANLGPQQAPPPRIARSVPWSVGKTGTHYCNLGIAAGAKAEVKIGRLSQGGEVLICTGDELRDVWHGSPCEQQQTRSRLSSGAQLEDCECLDGCSHPGSLLSCGSSSCSYCIFLARQERRAAGVSASVFCSASNPDSVCQSWRAFLSWIKIFVSERG